VSAAVVVLPFGGIGTSEMILMFLVVLLLTGGKALPGLGRSLGESVRDMARSMAGKKSGTLPTAVPPPAASPLKHHFGEAARGLLAAARSEATRLRGPDVRPEHVLMALMLQRDRSIADVLSRLGVDPDQLQRRAEASLGPGGTAHVPDDAMDYAVGTRRLVDAALMEAMALGHARVDPVHVLLALAQEGGDAGEVLRSLGVRPDEARRAAASVLA
jgi:hypothetical protein